MENTWGSVEDWNVFRETCETLGLRIWMDWVMNHTAWDHPWVEEHPEFYHQDENGKLHHPLGTDWTDVVQLNGAHAEVLL
jgi:glycosidase